MYVDPKKLKPFDYSRQLFPKLQGNAYELLKDDIKENGIRTPLEVTKDFLILCGHERQQIALELGLEKVPVEVYPSDVEADQKIRVIKDNLARKAVDNKTKLLCFGELKRLYGLKERANIKQYPRDEKGHIMKPVDSTDFTGVLTEDEIAKEVGITGETYRRSMKVLESDYPDKIKDAVFDGEISLRPMAELTEEPKEIQESVINELLIGLEEDRHVPVIPLVEKVKHQLKKEQSEIEQQTCAVEDFFTRYATALKNDPLPDLKNNDIETAITFFKNLLQKEKIHCPLCGETHLTWRCGHEF